MAAGVLGAALVLLLYTGVGALIGYVTNVVAVKLLFHPKKPVRILFFRLQGLIPARFNLLAERVAEVVSEYVSDELIEESIRDALRAGTVRRALAATIDDAIRGAIVSRAPFLAPFIDTRRISEPLAAAVESLIVTRRDFVEAFAKNLTREMNLKERIRQVIMSTDPDTVEEMFRRMASRELRFIEFSGALLGGMIGFIQGVVTLLLFHHALTL